MPIDIRTSTTAALAAASVLLAGVAPSSALGAVKKIDGKNLKTKSVSGKSLRDRTVTTGKLALGAVNASRLLDGAVGASKLADGSVTQPKLAAGAVNSEKIQDGTIVFGDLSASVQAMFTAPGVQPGGINTDHLADNAVTAAKIAPDAVGDEELAPNGVNSDEVQDNTLTADDLAANSVDSSEIASNAVGPTEIANGTLNAGDVGMRNGTTARDFPAIPANSCSALTIDTGDGGNLDSDVVMVTPRQGFAGSVSFHSETNANDNITIKACNGTAGAIDPDGAGGTFYNWIVFDN